MKTDELSQAVEIILVHPYSLRAFQWYQEHSRFKPILGGCHKLGKNQAKFQTGSHHEDWWVSQPVEMIWVHPYSLRTLPRTQQP
jgi:hypothetical protein